jgi:hypothetical protein
MISELSEISRKSNIGHNQTNSVLPRHNLVVESHLISDIPNGADDVNKRSQNNYFALRLPTPITNIPNLLN